MIIGLLILFVIVLSKGKCMSSILNAVIMSRLQMIELFFKSLNLFLQLIILANQQRNSFDYS